MWVFTKQGFYSVVVHRDDASLVLVRARVREDLENLTEQMPGLAIFEDERADYRFRAIVAREDWEIALVRLSQEMDYDNFKDAVTARQGQARHDVYLSVWSVLLNRLQRALPRRLAPGQLAFSGSGLQVEDDRADVGWGELPWGGTSSDTLPWEKANEAAPEAPAPAPRRRRRK